MRSRENVFTHECSSFKGTRNSFFPVFSPLAFFPFSLLILGLFLFFFFSRGYVSSPGLEYFTDWEMGEENFSRIVLEFDFKEKKAGGNFISSVSKIRR